MIFGFATAVIAGFLLTAVQNWTKLPTANGLLLGGLAGLWLLGRVLMNVPMTFPLASYTITGLVNLAFLPVLAFVLSQPIFKSNNTRNYKILAIIAALWLSQLAIFSSIFGWVELSAYSYSAVRGALDLVIILILVVTGRIVPLFTRNATGVQTIRSLPFADVVAIGGAVALLVLGLMEVGSLALGVVSAITGAFVLIRMIHWGTKHTLKTPLLWILHLGHAWVGIGFLLQAIEQLGVLTAVPSSRHALAAGAIGTLTLGMMARVGLGHTGRELKTHPLTNISFVVLSVGVLLRVLAPLAYLVAGDGAYQPVLDVAGTLWVVAFVLFLIVYVPILLAPRPDGKPG